MSYDISLVDPVTKETLQLPCAHVMTGGTFMADYDENTGMYTPKPTTEAWLNITYNYSHYYYEATDKDPRFAHDEVSAYYADGTKGPIVTEYGIRGIYGKTGAESIPLLEDMIRRITERYQKDGKWIDTSRKKVRYLDVNTHRELSLEDMLRMPSENVRKEEYEVIVNEGSNPNYWEATAVNAIRPLHQLIVMAKLRPDGVWEGD